MSREIKFRVWHKPTKKYVTMSQEDWSYGKGEVKYKDSGDFLAISNDGFLCHEGYGNGADKVEDPENYVVQQYTGLKDKNGQEIYEGDLLVKQSVSRTVYLVDFNDENYGWMMGWNLLEYGIIDDNGYCSELDKVTGINNPEIMNYPVKSYYYGSSPDDTYEVMGTIFEGITSEKL